MKITRSHLFLLLMSGPAILLWAGCSHAHNTAPVVTAPPPPPHKTWLDQTAESTQHAADATWHVVSAPVRWATAKKPPTTQPTSAPAPDAIIMQGDADGVIPIMVPLAEEPATRPTTRPKPH